MMTGAANRWSTGMSKNPWICALCRSIVSTRCVPGGAEQVRDELGRNRHSGLVLAVLPGVAVIGHHRRDPRGRRAAERVDSSPATPSSAGPPDCTSGWTIKTSAPRIFSSIWNETSLSGNRRNRAWPIGMPRKSAISLVSDRCALPENIFRSPNPVDVNPSPLRGRLISVGYVARLFGSWLGRKDSNLRIRDPKTRALPLGHAPPWHPAAHQRRGLRYWRSATRSPSARVVQTPSVVET